MLYRPADGQLWDTTLVHHEDWFHLFHLRDGKTLGHARSRDCVRWEPRELIDLRGPAGAWNEKGAPWTGCVVCHEGRFYLLAGGVAPDGIAAYGMWVSEDLDQWQPAGDSPVLRPELPHYRREASDLNVMHAAWRDPHILRDDAGWYHAFLCARTPECSADGTGAVVAHARSRDLRSWEYLPPIAHVGDRVLFAEVPDVFRMGDWWYLLLLDHGWGGTRINTPARNDQAGTFYLKSRRMEGPYEWPDEPLLIGCGDDMVGPWAARSLAVGQQRWLYFHHNGREKAFGLPKRIEQEPNGDLHLAYLPLLEALLRPVPGSQEPSAHGAKPCDLGEWSRSRDRLIGEAAATGTARVQAEALTDGEVVCEIVSKEAARAGVVIRAFGEHGHAMFEQSCTGLAIWLDFECGRVLLQDAAWVPGFGWGRHIGEQVGQDRKPHTIQEVSVPLQIGHPYRLRVLVRDEYVEVYLDDRWVISASDCPIRSGGVELALERGQAEFRDLAIQSLPPLVPSQS
jgi:glycosyl hydrolase family 32